MRAEFPVPNLTSIFPQGGKQGSSFDVTLTGADLDGGQKLLFSHPGLTSTPKMSAAAEGQPAKPVPNTFTVTIGADVPPGIYECRLQGRYGLSGPRSFQVGVLREQMNDGANKSPAKALELLPDTTINGKIDAESVQYFSLALKKGQTLVFDCYAFRLDSRLNGVLTLFDSSRRELVRARDTESRDPVLDFTAPADGAYTLALSDFVYNGGPEFPYRLTAHTGPRIDAIYPPCAVPGGNGQFTVYGRNLPGGQAAPGLTVRGRPVEQYPVSIPMPGDDSATARLTFGGLAPPNSSPLDGFSWQMPSPQGASNALTVYFASAPVVLEQEPNDDPAQAQKIALPCEYVGRFGAGDDRDWVEFEVPAGAHYTADVISNRMGLDTDPAIALYKITVNEQGEEKTSLVQQADDPEGQSRDGNRNRTQAAFELTTEDPTLDIKPEKTATRYRLLLRNQFADTQQDVRRSYRLCLRPSRGDFRLVVTPLLMVNQKDNRMSFAPLVLRQGGATVVTVRAFRRDSFDGEIQISAENLPPGITCSGAILGGGVESIPLVFSAAENAIAMLAPLHIVGRATVDGKELVREARFVTMVWPPTNNNQGQPMVARLARDFALAVVDQEQSPASVQAGDGEIIETAPGGKIELPLKVARRAGFNDALTLTTLGVPDTLKPRNEINIAAGDGNGKMEIVLTNPQLKPGTYTFCLRGEAKFKYARDPEALKSAEAEKQEVEAQAKEMQAKAKQAAAAKSKLSAAVAECAGKVKQADDARRSAEKVKQAAADKAKQKQDQLAAAQQAAAAAGAGQAQKDAALAAEKEAGEAAAAAEKAAADLADSETALADATAAAKAAAEEKTEAEKAVGEAESRQKMLEERKKTLDGMVLELKKNAGPKDTTSLVVSNPIRVRISPAPLALPPLTAPGPLKQNDKLEVPVAITRLFGYAEGVEVTCEAPPGLDGLRAPKIDIPQDQTAGRLTLSAASNVPPGEHKVTIRAKAKWNNVLSEVKQELLVQVEPGSGK